MRLPIDEDPDRARATIAAARDAGITVFDTARAYTPWPERLGEGERFLAAVLAADPAAAAVRVLTKGGMTRPGGAWVPDGRAKTIAADCEASLEALDGLPIDLYLLHAPDPRTPWATSIRALGRLLSDGLVSRVGVANVTRAQLDEACAIAPISAVQVALSVVDDGALRGGLVDRCEERGIAVIAHSPLGGPRRVSAVRDRPSPELAAVAQRYGASTAEVALACVLASGPGVIAIPGATKPETIRSAVRAASLELDVERASSLGLRRPPVGPSGASVRSSSGASGVAAEVVMIMGIPASGKTRLAASWVERGYVRLNRDDRGGTLKELAAALDSALAAGATRLVLDNTYLTRAARSHVLEIAARRGAAVRCVHLEITLEQAQVNLVERLLETFGALPTPQQIKAEARRSPGLMLPTSQMRTLRELEPPQLDEGFSAVERVPFVREARGAVGSRRRRGVVIAAGTLPSAEAQAALADHGAARPCLVFDWRPGAGADAIELPARLATASLVEVAVCPHPGGPPSCWCRPPLPGLPLAFARRHGLDPAWLTVIGASPAHRTMARALGASYEPMALADSACI